MVQQQTGAFARAGGEILFGTDIGYTTGYDTSEEVRLLAGAGLDWRQILASLTTVPAKRFGDGDRGRLKAGGAADLVLLEGNPMDDIGALSRARCTFRAGKPVYEATPGACAGSR